MKQTLEARSISSAFIKYAAMGVSGCRTPFDIYSRICGMFGSSKHTAAELWAVHECLLILNTAGEHEVLDALGYVYLDCFKGKHGTERKLKKNEISDRVLRFAMRNHIDERTVYRRLGKARKLWRTLISMYELNSVK